MNTFLDANAILFSIRHLDPGPRFAHGNTSLTMSHEEKKKKRLPDESPNLVSPKRLMTWEGVLSNGVSTGVCLMRSPPSGQCLCLQACLRERKVLIKPVGILICSREFCVFRKKDVSF